MNKGSLQPLRRSSRRLRQDRRTSSKDPMKALLPLLAAAIAIAAPAAAQPSRGASPIRPGYWESTNRVLSPIRTRKVERRCIRPSDVDKFLAGPSNHHYDCTYPTHVVENGVIQMAGTCVERKGGRQVRVSGQGVYTPDSFSLTADIATHYAGIPLAGRASTSARRISDSCPDDAAGLTLK
jgi:hypothetical protein